MLDMNRLLEERNININIDKDLKSYLASKFEEQPIEEYRFDIFDNIDKFIDMDKAVDLIHQYYNDGKFILVTDYDCDGISSALVLDNFMKILLKEEYSSRCITIVNKRQWGNGLNNNLLKEILDIRQDKWIEDKILVITADMCSSDNIPIGTLKTRGIDVILTDHHVIPEDNYPTNANVVINIMRKDNSYPHYISGAYTAFLLCISYIRKYKSDLLDITINALVKYAGISTVVDQMPMNNHYNRNNALVSIRALNRNDNNSMLFLNKLLGLPKALYNKAISWSIGPFINSGNRCNTERALFEGLAYNDEHKIKYAFQENNRRKVEQKEIFLLAENDVYKFYPNMEDTYAIAIVIETDLGIAGPIASRVGETFNRPVIVFRRSKDTDILSGSGRAIIDIDILSVLKEIKEEHSGVIYKAAGHAGACGVEIYTNQLDRFRELFSKKVKDKINGKLPKKLLNVASIIKPENISLNLALQVEHYGPYGKDWEEPLFISKLKFKSSYNMGKAKLCTFERYGKTTISGVYNFDRPNGITYENWNEMIVPDEYYYIVYSLQLGYYRGNYQIDISIKDIFK